MSTTLLVMIDIVLWLICMSKLYDAIHDCSDDGCWYIFKQMVIVTIGFCIGIWGNPIACFFYLLVYQAIPWPSHKLIVNSSALLQHRFLVIAGVFILPRFVEEPLPEGVKLVVTGRTSEHIDVATHDGSKHWHMPLSSFEDQKHLIYEDRPVQGLITYRWSEWGPPDQFAIQNGRIFPYNQPLPGTPL